jgi:hypothetical protein
VKPSRLVLPCAGIALHLTNKLNKLIHSNKLRPSSEIQSSSGGQDVLRIQQQWNIYFCVRKSSLPLFGAKSRTFYFKIHFNIIFTHIAVCPKQSIVRTSHFPRNLSSRQYVVNNTNGAQCCYREIRDVTDGGNT